MRKMWAYAMLSQERGAMAALRQIDTLVARLLGKDRVESRGITTRGMAADMVLFDSKLD